MRKNFNVDDDDTEERVYVSQGTCYNEEDIEEVIEQTKRDLARTSVPRGYTKLDEEIITTVYKMPENEIIHKSRDTNINKYIYKSSYNSEKKNYYNDQYKSEPRYEERYDYSEYRSKNNNMYASPNKSIAMKNINEDNYESSTNIQEINGGKIENYFENGLSQDGQYLISMTLSKKVLDEDEQNKEQGKYRNNYYKEEIEIDENDGDYKEKRSYMSSKVRDYGNNNESPLRGSFTRPINVYRNEYYKTNEEVNRYNNYPIKTEKNIYRYYRGNNRSSEKKPFEKMSNTQAHSMQFPAKYKKGEFKKYNY